MCPWCFWMNCKEWSPLIEKTNMGIWFPHTRSARTHARTQAHAHTQSKCASYTLCPSVWIFMTLFICATFRSSPLLNWDITVKDLPSGCWPNIKRLNVFMSLDFIAPTFAPMCKPVERFWRRDIYAFSMLSLWFKCCRGRIMWRLLNLLKVNPWSNGR